MKRHSFRTLTVALAAALVLAAGARTAHAQPINDQIDIKTSTKFKHAFRECIGEACKSTVRLQCDGKAPALGVVSVSARNVPKGQDPKSPNPNSGYLGVGLADATGAGAKVAQVLKDTPAAKAKLKDGDIILAVGEKEIRDSEHLVKTLGKFKP